MDVTIVEGSPRPRGESRSFALALLAGQIVADRGHDAHVVRVIDLDPSSLVHRDLADLTVRSSVSQLVRSDALVVVTPIFQASFSGLLKLFLDLLPRTALEGKPALALATCGSSSHGSVVTFALPPVLLALGCQHVIPPLCLPPPTDPLAMQPLSPKPLPTAEARRLDERMNLLLAATTPPTASRLRPGHDGGMALQTVGER